MADRAKAAAFDKAAAEERRKNEAAAGGMDSAFHRCIVSEGLGTDFSHLFVCFCSGSGRAQLPEPDDDGREDG